MLRAYTQSRRARVGVVNAVDLGHYISASLKGSSEPTRGYFRPEDVSDGKVNVLVIGEDKLATPSPIIQARTLTDLCQ